MAAIALIGMAVSAASTMMQMNAQAAQAKGQANAARYAADQQRAAGTQNASNNFYNGEKTIGTAIARAASSGYGTVAGSSADVIGAMEGKNVYNARSIIANSENQAKGNDYTADLYDMQAKQTKSAMPFALASSLVTGMTKFGSSFGSPNTWGASSQPASSPYTYG